MTGLLVLDQGEKKVVTGVSVSYDPTSQLSPIGLLRTAKSKPLFNRSERYDLEESIYFSSTTASGATITHDSNKVARVMSVSTTVGSKAVRRTRRRFRYVKGSPQYIIITGNLQGKVAGVNKTIGQFSDNNGFIIQLNGTTARVGIRSSTTGSVVDSWVTEDSWDDPLDGTGVSGVTIDWSKQHFFQIDYAWLGTADVRFGIYHEGKVIYFHTIKSSNILTTVYSQTAVLPIRMEIEQISGSSASTMEITCLAVYTDDGDTLAGSVRSGSTGAVEQTVSTTEQIFFGLRVNSSYRANIKPIDYQVFIPSGNATVYFKVLFNPTIVGGSWAAVGSGSTAETLSSYTSFSGGTIMDEGYAAVGSNSGVKDLKSDIELGDDLSNASDVLVLVARTTSSNSKMLFSGTWREDT